MTLYCRFWQGILQLEVPPCFSSELIKKGGQLYLELFRVSGLGSGDWKLDPHRRQLTWKPPESPIKVTVPKQRFEVPYPFWEGQHVLKPAPNFQNPVNRVVYISKVIRG